jgi:hypothetical protein
MGWRKFSIKFPGYIVPKTTGIHERIKKVKYIESLTDKKPARKCRVLTKEKLDEIGARLEHTSHKLLKLLAQGTSV